MNDYKKELNGVAVKIENKELENKEELDVHLAELKYRGILTQAQINSQLKELLEMLGKSTKKTSKRVTRTPQSELFEF